MDRRSFLHSAAGGATLFLAGCLGDGGGDRTDGTAAAAQTMTETPPPSSAATATGTPDGPRGVYVQSFRETMVMPGTATDGNYRFALLLAVPHRFWTVTGSDRSTTPIDESDDVHLMASVWDPQSGAVLPDSGLDVEITRDGDLVSQEVIYPMLSQRMGFHYGANFGLEGDGTYAATVNVGGVSARTTGAFDGRFDDGASATIEFEWNRRTRERLKSEALDQAGNRGALRPMEMGDLPQPRAPDPDALPGTTLGTGRSDDAKLVATQLAAGDADRFADDDPYLAVSARTPFNRLVLPSMGLSATVTRDGETVFDGRLRRTLDPELGYHYGAGLPEQVESGDQVTLSVGTPPQLSRHEGYERAFLQMTPATIEV